MSALAPARNVHLHDLLELWFEREVRPHLRRKSILVRYADDFVIRFEVEEDERG